MIQVRRNTPTTRFDMIFGPFFLLFAAVVTPTTVQALANVPDLATLPTKIFQSRLNFKVAFGEKDNPFPIQNVLVELDSNRLQTSRQKGFSSGIFEATLVGKEKPFYINDKGLQEVTFVSGGWEVRWPRKSPHGVLVCSFIVPETIKRNDKDDAEDAPTIEQGRFFIHHRMWSKTTLESERARRRKIQGQAAQYLKERDEQVKKLVGDERDTNEENALTRMIAYGKAAKSMNDFRTSGLQEARFIPLYDDQVLELDAQDCILSTRGLIYMAGAGESRRNLAYTGESRVDFPKKETTTTVTLSTQTESDTIIE